MAGSGVEQHASPQSAQPTPSYRYDIEGLRAVAAILVAVYHIWLGRVSGGVDVFFVIAGFLITGTLLRQLHRTGRINPGRFLGRLLVRLLPNALTVLLAVGVATVVLLPVTRRAEVFREIIASALYFENWALIGTSVDYLARDRGDSPVQHFWAMSIQGQFYVWWLVLAMLAMVVGARLGAGRRLMVLIAATVAVSFACSVLLTAADQPVAYFHTAARAWEFGVGGLVAALLIARPRWRYQHGPLLTWVGLALVLTTGLLVPVGGTFPGVVALLPVTGAVLILLGGHRNSTGASRVLSTRPLVSLGGVAYAIYLWHWPVLIFTLQLRGVDRAGLVDGIAVLGVSIALAYLSTMLLEKPVRGLAWQQWEVWRAPTLGLLTTVGFVSLVAAAGAASVPTMPSSDGVRLAHWAERGATPDFSMPPSDDPYPGIAVAAQDRAEPYRDGCTQGLRGAEVIRCVYGAEDAPRRMVLTGGSHALHWHPAIEEVAVQRGWQLELITKGGCRSGISLVGPEYALYGGQDEINASCRVWDADVLSLLLADPPDLVVGNITAVTDGEPDHLPPYYEAFWRELDRNGVESVGIRATPRGPDDRVDCLAAHGSSSAECDLDRETTLAEVNPAAHLGEELEHLTVVDLSEWLCTDTTCPAVIEDTVVYHDQHHLTATFSRSLAQVFFREEPKAFN